MVIKCWLHWSQFLLYFKKPNSPLLDGMTMEFIPFYLKEIEIDLKERCTVKYQRDSGSPNVPNAKDLLNDEMPSGVCLSNSSNSMPMLLCPCSRFSFMHGFVLLFASIVFICMHSLKFLLFLHYSFLCILLRCFPAKSRSKLRTTSRFQTTAGSTLLKPKVMLINEIFYLKRQ